MSEFDMISLASIVILGIGAQWLAWRFQAPAILLLLAFGFIAGPITGFLDPERLLGGVFYPLISISVAVILFEGGLSLKISELKAVGTVVRNLLTIGALLTWVIGALACRFFINLDWKLSILCGAIMIVTGPTVIGPLLRHIHPRPQVRAIMKWEGILIDPIGALLTILVYEAIVVGELKAATGLVIFGVVKIIFAGLLMGLLAAALITIMLKRYYLPDYLHSPLALMIVILAFVVSNSIQKESGLLTATVMGLVLANQKYVSVRHIIEFKENLRVLILSSLFVILAARLQPSQLSQMVQPGSLAILAIMVLGARPLAVAVSSWRSKLNVNERIFLGGMAPRGIVAASVASIFALRLGELGYPGAGQIVPLIFMIIIGTVIIYGITSPILARKLKVAASKPQGLLVVGAYKWIRELAHAVVNAGFPVTMVDTNRQNIAAARLAGLNAYYGSILTERTTADMDMDGIGRMLALTTNDEVNSLACLRFADVFGRREVYQLKPAGKNEHFTEGIAPEQRGRFLFQADATHAYLADRFAAGSIIKATPLSKEFDEQSFWQRYGRSAIPFFLINPSGELLIFTDDQRWKPAPNHTLICLIDRECAPAVKTAAAPEEFAERDRAQGA